jgi:hypothetical protein
MSAQRELHYSEDRRLWATDPVWMEQTADISPSYLKESPIAMLHIFSLTERGWPFLFSLIHTQP